MHPRNIFRDVNFGVLAEKYSFFKGYVFQDPKTLKYNLNFGDDDAVRALNRVLLLEYYNLDVDIPNDCLIPRVPLRLNYILWIEDVLEHFKDQFPESKTVIGLDIGTGPCAIYALLGAKKNNNWIMHGTDINERSIELAKLNVLKNKLEGRVKLHQVTQDSYFSGSLLEDPEDSFDFSMCNPPFFSDTKDELVSSNYPSIPWSSKSQIQQEIVFPGGEVSFVDDMIKESYNHPNLVKIYTTMIGVKKHLDSLLKRLREYKCSNFITCIFHQGRISRWGLAWSWDKSINLKLGDSSFRKQSSQTLTATFTNIPSFKTFLTQLERILKDNLGMSVEKESSNNKNMNTFFMRAERNTWSHSRRKRRLELQQASKTPNSSSRSQHQQIVEDCNSNANEVVHSQETSISNDATDNNKDLPAVKTPRMMKKDDQDVDDSFPSDDTRTSLISMSTSSRIEIGRKSETLESENNGQGDNHMTSSTVSGSQTETGLHFKLNVTRQSTDVMLQLHYLSGTFGKDGVHQVLQYLKNQSFTSMAPTTLA